MAGYKKAGLILAVIFGFAVFFLGVRVITQKKDKRERDNRKRKDKGKDKRSV
ncbi:hypothetical protein [Helicobacter pylori]|uniref:hypothetical protein n=1 Tax=Helicobacter pylori TaxID=210 RepID=UPI0015E7FFD2|nr:hypothetical protein [Helicobacter pylori]